jgi:signal transduction histidine kinase
MSIVAMQAAIVQRLVASDPTDTSQRLRASAMTIQPATERMNSLLHDLLDLAKIEAGRFEVAASAQSAIHLIEDACGLLQSIAEAKGVELTAEPAPDASIQVDPERIFAKGIVEAHGGTLRLESRLGEGASFMFTVPLA